MHVIDAVEPLIVGGGGGHIFLSKACDRVFRSSGGLRGLRTLVLPERGIVEVKDSCIREVA